jgi:hypothetical protein
MGWGRTLLLGDVGNRLDIGDCEKMIAELYRDAANKNRVNTNQDSDIQKLQFENEQLKLYLVSLVRLLITKGVIEEDEFRRFVDIIDGEDGKMDGRTPNLA